MSNEKTDLELEKLRVEIQKEQVELLKALNDIRDHEIKTGYSVINRRIVRLADEISDETVGDAREKLYDLSRLYPDQSLILDINSPGGGVHPGLELFGVLRELSGEGHQIITRISGHAASMGGVIAQAGDVRQIREHSYLHLHEVSSGAIGKMSGIKDAADYADKLTKDLMKIYANRSQNPDVTPEWMYEKVIRNEWWLDATEALERGFVDEII